MVYAVVINLDTENHPKEVCDELWSIIKCSMIDAGFLYIRNTFTINQPAQMACELARQTIENIESHLEYYNRHLHHYIKDFYGFDVAATTNLLTPATDKIRLREKILEDTTVS